MIEALVPQASTFAADIDFLFDLIFYIVGFWFVLTFGTFLWLLWSFRKRDGHQAQYVTGELKHEKRFITIPHMLVLVCDVFIIVGAVRVWYDVKQVLPEPDSTVRIISQQWAWSFEHPGPDNVLGTADDIRTVDDLNLEIGKTYHYKLESLDVLHDFSVPAFRLKQDAIPGRVITGWFTPTLAGSYDIQCAEICGIGHGLMPAKVHVQTAEEHAAWMAANSPAQGIADASGDDDPTVEIASNVPAAQE